MDLSRVALKPAKTFSKTWSTPLVKDFMTSCRFDSGLPSLNLTMYLSGTTEETSRGTRRGAGAARLAPEGAAAARGSKARMTEGRIFQHLMMRCWAAKSQAQSTFLTWPASVGAVMTLRCSGDMDANKMVRAGHGLSP